MLFDDAIDGGQTEAGALADFFGGEKRLKDARYVFLRNAATGVRFAHANKTSNPRLRMTLDMGLINLRDSDTYAELAAARHGIASVHGEVQQNLFHHAGIGLDRGRRRGVIQLQRHVFTQKPPEHFRHVADDLVQIQSFGLDELAPAEGQQLAGEAGRPLGRLDDLLSGTRGGLVQLSHAQQRSMPVDDGEDVVEIMRHAAGELADSLHLLRLAQLFLQPPLQRHIAEQTQHKQGPPGNFHKGMRHLQHQRLPAAQIALVLAFLFRRAGHKLIAVPGKHSCQAFRFRINDGERSPFQSRRIHPNQFAESVVDRDNEAVFVSEPHPIRRIFPDGTKQHLGTLQGLLSRTALDDIADVQQQRGFVLVFDPAGAHLDRNDPPIGRQALSSIQVSFPSDSF